MPTFVLTSQSLTNPLATDPTNSSSAPHDQVDPLRDGAQGHGARGTRPRGLRVNTVNEGLASAASKAVTDPAFESRKGFCSRFVREVVASVYGDSYQDLFGPSALATAAFPRLYYPVPK